MILEQNNTMKTTGILLKSLITVKDELIKNYYKNSNKPEENISENHKNVKFLKYLPACKLFLVDQFLFVLPSV